MKRKPNKRNVQNKTRNANKKRKVFKIKNRDQTIETESEDENVIPYADDSDDDYSEEGLNIDNRWYCFVCQREQILSMRLCISCKRYVHETCVGLTNQDDEPYICHEYGTARAAREIYSELRSECKRVLQRANTMPRKPRSVSRLSYYGDRHK
ncbi:hypothetical protein K1T71_013065 [Dendrolimus kikuchii]|uniref:Uncharacterized protein n=1 Tax=Dendrolimus kikuchii TaxID=765133 RepID=A0ACC1CIV3_9NEOP|nr:hypothetical protein K1T71_013065 [Dendrolimus kikuchii]